MNQYSSRSHTVFQFCIETKRKSSLKSTRSKFNIVDLAGSEKWNMNIKMEASHISEMTKINLRYIYTQFFKTVLKMLLQVCIHLAELLQP